MLPLLSLFSWVICCQGVMEGSQSFLMFQISHFWDPSSVQFWGNASLRGWTTHTLEGSGHNITIQQLEPLESPERWKQTKEHLLKYLHDFQLLVQLVNKERGVAFPLTLRCFLGCELPPDGQDAHVFYEVALNGSSFVSFQPEKVLWSASPEQSHPPELYDFTLKQLNNYNQTRFELLEFLQDTCVSFLKQHMNRVSKSASRDSRSYTMLILGIIMGVFTISSVAVGIFLCTGGRWS
ncbi:endothelial protein C receptor [Phascolarctos cinereus]|uniref:Endothelial protein C receptor n=1 Tax=Phascolarctos cinereus TaxID=38626 RepID=A0A6P5LCC1_PHACI|nr:endothelial protein C receptor [Phascolarctos cinereus]XP_020854389.1 endothelial protein C receptor [Phascolarctos cinereus]